MAFNLPMRIETQRLVVRVVEECDLVELLSINADEAVTRYLPYESWKSLDSEGSSEVVAHAVGTYAIPAKRAV